MQILDGALILSPYLSDDQHGEVLRLCAVLLLAYLLPYSTGMDYYFAQNISAGDERLLGTFSIEAYIIQMSLEERLEHVARHCPSTDRCGDDEFTVLDQDTEIAFGHLLDQITKLLQQRPIHTHQVDLIHLFAIMIYPCHHTEHSISNVVHPTTMENSPAWVKAVRLMESSIGSTFQIHYGHRRQVVQMISKCVFIRDGIYDFVPLYAGALPHLFASLHQFIGRTSESIEDSHDAFIAIVALAVQSRHRSSEKQDDCRIIKSTYDWLISLMMEERLDCRCTGYGLRTCASSINSKGRSFCTFYSRGEVLSDLIILTCRSKQAMNAQFLSYVAISLAELIEWQADHWNAKLDDTGRTDTTNVDNESKTYSPCLLSSLLFAARQLFYFLESGSSVNQTTYSLEDDDPINLLIRSSIAMLQHPDWCVVSAAKELLVQAFVMIPGKEINQHVLPLSHSITVSHEKQNMVGPLMHSLLAVISGRSYSAANSLFNFILTNYQRSLEERSSDVEKQSENALSKEEVSTWLMIITMNCPLILSKNSGELLSLVAKNALSAESSCLVVESLLYSRLTHYFVNDTDTKVGSVVENFLSLTRTDFWEKYKMGRHALISGHFGQAQMIFRLILNECESLDTQHYLWISTLERLSDAEATFAKVTDLATCKGSSIGIPDASTKLYSTVSYMEQLQTMRGSWANSGVFQLHFLLLRLDFMDLVVVLRHLTRERRLTGKSPNKNTRSYWHLQNVVKSFERLACRYHVLYRQFGMCFKHNQSTVSFALLQSLSSFMAVVARMCFSDIFSPGKSAVVKIPYVKVSDDINHPMASLMRRLHELVVEPVIGATAIDNRIRAAATLELIDGILLVPFPIPRDFFFPMPSCKPIILISADPNPVYDEYDETLSVIECAPLLGFSFYVSGSIDVDYLKVSRVPVWSIVLWFYLKYVGPLISDDDDNNDLTGTDTNMNDDASVVVDSPLNEVPIPDLSAISPAVSKIYSSGQFFFEVECPPLTVEGNYILCSKLGCRDANGNDWEVPGCYRTVPVQMSRARSISKSNHEKQQE